MKKAPFYIALDGLDGSGKTSQIKLLGKALEAAAVGFINIREPGQTPDVGSKIREILLTGGADKLDPMTEALLFSADRRHTMRAVTRPAMEEGLWVVSDRSFLTTTVYQGYGHGISLESLEALHTAAVEDVRPDVQVILDIPVEVGLARKGIQLGGGPGAEDRFERLPAGFHERVRQGFLSESKKLAHVVMVDASGEMAEVHERVIAAVNGKLGVSLRPVAVVG